MLPDCEKRENGKNVDLAAQAAICVCLELFGEELDVGDSAGERAGGTDRKRGDRDDDGDEREDEESDEEEEWAVDRSGLSRRG